MGCTAASGHVSNVNGTLLEWQCAVLGGKSHHGEQPCGYQTSKPASPSRTANLHQGVLGGKHQHGDLQTSKHAPCGPANLHQGELPGTEAEAVDGPSHHGQLWKLKIDSGSMPMREPRTRIGLQSNAWFTEPRADTDLKKAKEAQEKLLRQARLQLLVFKDAKPDLHMDSLESDTLPIPTYGRTERPEGLDVIVDHHTNSDVDRYISGF